MASRRIADVSELKTRAPTMGLVYRSARMYRLSMRLLEGRAAAHRLKVIVEAIEPGWSVLDLCCGDAAIAPSLIAKGCPYVGLDINPAFVRWGRRNQIDVRLWDANTMEIPSADVICMLSSLYQFIPDDRALLETMRLRAHKLVIVSEPVRNWASSDSALLRWASHTLTHVDGRAFVKRHTEASLRSHLNDLRAEARAERLPRELVLFIKPTRANPSSPAARTSTRG